MPLGGCVGQNLQLDFDCWPQIFTGFLHETYPNDSPCDVASIYFNKMALIWREREHEEHNFTIGNDPATIQALRDCELLKFFGLPGMRHQIELLRYLVRAWDVQAQAFILGAHTLEILVAEIYFLTRLSR